MIEFLAGHHTYWLIFALMLIGLYGMVTKKNLVKKVIGMSIFQSAVILFFVAGASRWNAAVPVLKHGTESIKTGHYMNPLPHTLMLTAIVVGVATSGVAFALIITIYRRYRTLEEPDLLEKMKNAGK